MVLALLLKRGIGQVEQDTSVGGREARRRKGEAKAGEFQRQGNGGNGRIAKAECGGGVDDRKM